MPKFTPKAEEFLKGKHFGKLATVRKDGSPHVTPIWYMLESGRLFVNTTTGRVKYHNIRRDPRVSFLVDDGYPYVMVEGRARIAEERDAKKDIETLAVRYTGEEAGRKAAKERYWKDPRVSIEIVPEKIVVGL
ncbi:MAG: PPOX class F420-dependent oxidoreductase [Nitrososphaerota archaeon]|nr:PPOX class F420-dependent oxidoreductase [Nitrososphaerota archaeon]MDG7023870.1 PPOX class F420-dependent oxidoreductase [Nitrososphaerota archaeon]